MRSRLPLVLSGLLLLALAGTSLALDRGDWQRDRDLIWPDEYANPDIVSLGDDGWRAYLMSPGGIVSARSTNGRTFTFEEGVRVQGQHHALAPLEDGRLRIYYSTATSEGVVSAVSENGLDFTPEPGVRLPSKPRERPIHLDVIRAGSGWRMYYDADASEPGEMAPDWRGIRSAYSPDGLSWQRERGWRIDEKTSGLRSASLVWSPFAERRGGKVDLLFSVETSRRPEALAGIWRARSKNGRAFDVVRGPELGVDPRVKRPEPGPGGLSGLPQDPFVIRVEDGQRLFYWEAREGNFSAFKPSR
jgi:hypothetical protein